MIRFAACLTPCIALLFVATTAQAGQYGTPQEAKAMLEKAVAAVKEDKGKALDMFNKGEGGFKKTFSGVLDCKTAGSVSNTSVTAQFGHGNVAVVAQK